MGIFSIILIFIIFFFCLLNEGKNYAGILLIDSLTASIGSSFIFFGIPVIFFRILNFFSSIFSIIFSFFYFFLSLLSYLWIGAQFPQEKFLSYARILTLYYYFLLMCILFFFHLLEFYLKNLLSFGSFFLSNLFLLFLFS